MAKSKLRIMRTIDDIEELVNSCKPGVIHPEMIKIDRDELLDLVGELRKNTPEEVRGYAEMYEKKDLILSEAREEADRIRKEARDESEQLKADVAEKMSSLLSESEISQRANENAEALINDAKRHAEKIIADANAEADEIVRDAEDYEYRVYTGFQQYMNEQMSYMQALINDTINETTRNSGHLVDSLTKVLNEVKENLQAANAQAEEAPEQGGISLNLPEEN